MIQKVLIVLFCLFIIGIVFSYIVAGRLSSPHQSIILKPKNIQNLSSVCFQTKRNTYLDGWFIKGDQDKGGILLMHGVRSNRMQMFERAKWLHSEGYNILLFDFQAHGASKGNHITFGYLESEDANAAFNFLKSKLVRKNIVVIGVSLGGASALLSDIPSQADGLILESVYPTIEEAVSNRISTQLGSIASKFTPLLLWQIKPRLGFSSDVLKPIEHLNKIKSPTFIISGEKDTHTTKEETVRIYSNAPHPKYLWIVPNAVHQDIFQHSPNLYKEKVLYFIKNSINR